MKYYTSLDIERFIKQKHYSGEWPATILDVSGYWEHVRILVNDLGKKGEVKERLREWFGDRYDDSHIELGVEGRIKLDLDVSGGHCNVSYDEEDESYRKEAYCRKPRAIFEWDVAEELPDIPDIELPNARVDTDIKMIAFWSHQDHRDSFAPIMEMRDKLDKVLLIDADPITANLTEIMEERNMIISYLDFMSAVHWNEDTGQVVGVIADKVEYQGIKWAETGTSAWFVPAYRGIEQSMQNMIGPHHFTGTYKNMWNLPTVWKALARRIGADTIIMDLPSGINEWNASYLLDPRIIKYVKNSNTNRFAEILKVIRKYDRNPDNIVLY